MELKGRVVEKARFAFKDRPESLDGQPRKVVIATAHKVGSTWLTGMIQSIGFMNAFWWMPGDCRENGTVQLNAESLRALERHRNNVFVKSHSLPPQAFDPNSSPSIRFVTILRDPRDVVISAAHYLALIPEIDGGWGEDFKALSIEKRIVKILKEGNFLLDRLEAWNNWPQAKVVRYEACLVYPEATLLDVLKSIGIRVDGEKVSRAVEENSFSVRKKSDPAFFRRGASDQWKNVFNDECYAAFESGLDGRWIKFLMQYET